ncbi:DUF4240 domain-containing protein [Aureivirga sp. CE67]|uniref:DUF4240 domain-containing protein n=1 Tax=Aureivirga sp. CE67 TaxID=1788983 RepID=UPI0018CA7C96|nr:DUF4240 domain-containing protein [Aureivirga sp. CE67]
MTEEIFWNLIGKFFEYPIEEINEKGYDVIQNEILEDYLGKADKESLIKFHELLCTKIRELYLPKIGDLFLLSGYDLEDKLTKDFQYISEDGFADFRAWIVSLGKEHFEKFKNFEKEEDLFEYDLDANGAFREDLIYIISRISETRFEEELDLDYDLENEEVDLYSKMNWNTLNEKYPKLFKFYQDRFKNGYYSYE